MPTTRHTPVPTADTDPAGAPTPANRAERRAARRGRSGAPGGPPAPRTAGPAPQARPAHVRTDFAARRSG
ncbi:hypothetical protein ACFU8R_17750 [Pseudonocardia alni]|jgi:hypothetical protein|uniref:Uncharacterized protein n=1 Tax=Pseudonocardia alni TaxID=33907 RepID=A0A852WCV5_PSEA5|nr:hypothetical protein [Pseudonocardia antarctica]NYG04564.1 hypothetical protein [Pseudonocardia antarctica]